jgi:enoyl-CoA hydratase/carnithine racemase
MEGEASAQVRVERREGIAVWTLDRPRRRNALSVALMDRLAELVRHAYADAALRAVVITGAGDRAFCAGADLQERRGMDDAAVLELLARYAAVFGGIDRLPVPVIAALNGAAIGGGLELALACDLRVADPEVRLALPETSLGIIPGAGGTQRLPRLVGLARAKQMVLLGQSVDAAEALAMGLVNAVAPRPGGALEHACAWAAQFNDGAPVALAAALTALDGSVDVSLEEGLRLERACYERTLGTADRREALEAFAQKRKPRFRGC